MKDISSRIISIASFLTGTDPVNITLTTDLYCDLMMDSLDINEFCMEIEKSFGIDITSEDVREMESIADAVDIVRSKFGNVAIQ